VSPFDLEVLPEFRAQNSIKLAPQAAVPTSERLLELIDSQTVQRLRRVRQLSLADRVFPSATHTRFSHALGVYRNLLDYLRSLHRFQNFAQHFEATDYLALLLAGLLHDIGHYPCSHQLDHLPSFPAHEDLTLALLRGQLAFRGENLADRIWDRFHVEPAAIIRLLGNQPANEGEALLRQLIDSPLDADKCDYLIRDSHNCGVDFGAGFDRDRFIDHLRPSLRAPVLGIQEKGVVSAEKFQLARYWMYRSVYWGHTVRALIRMLEESCESLQADRRDPAWQLELLETDDGSFLRRLAELQGQRGASLLERIDLQRAPFKRLFTFAFHHEPARYQRLLQAETREEILSQLRVQLPTTSGVEPDLLWDVPPAYKDERWETFPVLGNDGQERAIEQESPVIEALGHAFLKGVRRIRLFVRPDLYPLLAALPMHHWGCEGPEKHP
jgi:HD superfamily phosphohydrolase